MTSLVQNFYEKHNTLNKLAYFAFAYSGLMKKPNKKWFQLFTIFNLFCLTTAIFLGITELFVGSRKLEDFVGVVATITTCSFALRRAISFLLSKKEINSIMDRLELLRLSMLKDEENKYLVDAAEDVGKKLLTGIFVIVNGFPIAAFIYVTLTDYIFDYKEKHLIHRVWMPWSHEDTMNNILANIVITILSLPCISVYVGIHFWEISFTLYTSAYAKTLENNLFSKGLRNREVYEQHKFMIQIINDHNQILSGIKYWEAQISPLMPCGYGYSFLKALKRNEISIAVDYSFRVSLTLFPSVVTCCCGQHVISQMELLHQGTYMSKWYEETAITRKTFLTMMIRTTKPPTINYRLFVTFDHVLLTLILQTVYSYIMLMVNIDS